MLWFGVELASRRARLPASIGYQLEGNDAHRVDTRCSSCETFRLRHDMICLDSPSTTPSSSADSAGHLLVCPSSEVPVRHSFLAFPSFCTTAGHAAGHRAAGRSRCGISAETCDLAASCRAARDMAFAGARDTTPSNLFSWQSCSGGGLEPVRRVPLRRQCSTCNHSVPCHSTCKHSTLLSGTGVA